MKANLRATALLGSSSFVSILAAAVTSKFYAVRIDADGMGLSTLMQSVLGLGMMFSAFGIPVGVTREVAAASHSEDRDEQAAALVAAQQIVWVGNLVVFGSLLLFWPQISRLALGGAQLHVWEKLALVGAGAAMTWSSIQTAYLNGHQKLAELARFGVVSSLGSAACGITLIWLLGVGGIAPAILSTAIIGAILARVAIHRAKLPTRSTSAPVAHARKRLVRFGIPMMLSSALGTGLQFVLPILVLRMLDLANVGIYRAASAISVTYIGILITTISQEYYPRISAAAKESLAELLNDQHRLVLLLGVPIVCVGALASPIIIPILYKTGRFTAAVPVLQWQLIGDLLRLSSWTMSYIVLARSGSFAFFVMETIGAGIFLGSSWLGMHFLGIEGMGVGFLLSYALYWIVAATVLGQTARLRLSGKNIAIVCGVVATLVAVQVVSAHIPALLTVAIRGALALVAIAVCGAQLWTELRRRPD